MEIKIEEEELKRLKVRLRDLITIMSFLGYPSASKCKHCERKTVLEGYTCTNCGYDNTYEEETNG